MCIDTENLENRTIQVELVDNWHPRWAEVLDAIEHVGERDSLNVDADGWLSARQNLIVAFVDDTVAGHLCFRVEPSSENGQSVIAARVESVETQPGFDEAEIRSILRRAAEKRARSLRCKRLIG